MTYALQVCPYLAAPSYPGRVDTGTIHPDKIPPDVDLFFDPTMIPSRPALFVAVASANQIISQTPIGLRVTPVRPYSAVQYWRQGQRLPDTEGRELVALALKQYSEGTYAGQSR